jgi:hypothetical protein
MKICPLILPRFAAAFLPFAMSTYNRFLPGFRLPTLAKPAICQLALMASGVLGALAIQPGAAMAASACWFGVASNGLGQCSSTPGAGLANVLSVANDKQLTFLPGLNFGGASGTVNLNYIPGPELYTVNLDFTPDGSSLNKLGQIPYTFEVIKPGYEFASVKLTANSVNPTTFIAKTTVESGGKTMVLSSLNGVTDGPKPIGGTVITVVDDWSTIPGGVLDSFTNTFTQRRSPVPGPLPLLGAGAAFGFSRRLRNRCSLAVGA